VLLLATKSYGGAACLPAAPRAAAPFHLYSLANSSLVRSSYAAETASTAQVAAGLVNMLADMPVKKQQHVHYTALRRQACRLPMPCLKQLHQA